MGTPATADQVVTYLVSHNYLLTALELFMEACEAGREAEVEALHRLFRDPQRFPPEEVARHNPTDALSMQGVARDRERRLSLLDYELRVAQEDLQDMRRRNSTSGSAEQELPQQQQQQQQQAQGVDKPAFAGSPGQAHGQVARGEGGPSPSASPASAKAQGEASPGSAAVSPGRGLLTSMERRELLGAVRAFLADQGFKLAAMTLAEEIGNATPRGRASPAPSGPALSLLACYRAQQAQQELARQLAELQEVLRAAGEEAVALRQALAEAQQTAEREREGRLAAEADREFAQAKLSYALAQRSQVSGLNGSQAQPINGSTAAAMAQGSPPGSSELAGPLVVGGEGGPDVSSPAAASAVSGASFGGQQKPDGNWPLNGSSSSRSLAVSGSGSSFRSSQRQPNEDGEPDPAYAVPADTGARSDFSVLGVEGALDEVARSLPNILPHMLIPRRAELVPLLLAVCQEHPALAARRTTAGLLFHLIKRPSDAQRELIVGACATLARRIGPARTALELLPHVAAQAQHDCLERRVLVGEVLARLAPLLPPQALGPLLSGALVDLVEDPLPQVRSVAAGALAALAGALPDMEAYPQVQALVMRLSGDESGEVVEVVVQQVLPALLRRLAGSDLLYMQLLPGVLGELLGVLQRCPFLAGTDEAALVSGTALLRALPDQAQRQAGVLLQLLTAVLAALRAQALLSVPGWAADWADRQTGGGSGAAQLQLVAKGQAGQASAAVLGGAGSGPAMELSPTGPNPSSPFLDPIAPLPAPLAPGAVPGPFPLVAPGTPPASGGSGAPPSPNSLQWPEEGGGGHSHAGQGELGELPALAAAGGQLRPLDHPPSGTGSGGSMSSAPSGAWAPTQVVASGAASQPWRSIRGGSSDIDRPNPFALSQASSQEVSGLGRALTDPGEDALGAGQGDGTGLLPARSLTVPETAAGLGGPVNASSFAASGCSASPAIQGQLEGFDPLGPLPASSKEAVAGQQAQGGPALAPGASAAGQSSHQDARGGSAAALVPPAQRPLAWEEAAFGAWALSQQHAGWEAIEYMAMEALPQLIRSASMVPPTRDTLQLRRKFAAAFRAACTAFGPAFTRDVIEPALLAAGAVPDWRPAAMRHSLHVAALAHQLSPSSAEAERAGRCMAVPMLLAGVLPDSPTASAAADCVRRLLTDGGTGSGAWALTHPQLFVEAVRFSAEPPAKQAALLEVMWEAAVSRSAQARLSAALLAGALAPVLHGRQVTRQLLPAIVSLAGDGAQGVCGAGMAAAAEVLRAFPSDQQMHDVLLGELATVVAREGHIAELALLRALGPAASSASEDGLALWLLQRSQLLLATMHQRAACGRTLGQISESANALFDTLRLLEAHEFTSEQAHLNFVATLQALQREGDLLEPPQRDALAAMIADHASTSAEGAIQQRSSSGGLAAAPALHSFLPGGRRAVPSAGVSLATLAQRMGSGSSSMRLAAAPSSTQEVPLVALGVSRTGASSSSSGGCEAVVSWKAFRGWQYGAA